MHLEHSSILVGYRYDRRRPTIFDLVVSFGIAMSGAVRAVAAQGRRRQQYRDLLGLPDYLLKDIGLTREQVLAGMTRPPVE